MTFTQQDQEFMQLALDLAAQGIFTTTPNPSVGCVLVKEGAVVGKGFHAKAGEPHAEVMALREAGNQAKDSIAYVTLEPCSHFGRTPPCAKGLIEAGVKKVIVAMEDPNPLVAGRGISMLREAGIETVVGLLQEKAEALNKGFLMRMRAGRPYVRLKMAMTIDGKTATMTGESKWITGELARSDVQMERAKSSAILSASGTVLVDDPSLNVRWSQFPPELQQRYPEQNVRQPVRIIMDSRARVRAYHQLFQTTSPLWLVEFEKKNRENLPHFCEVLTLSSNEHQSKLQTLMYDLGRRQINSLWVEAGANFAGALLAEELVDELIVYIAPKLLGDQARGLCHLPHLTKLADAPLWQLESITQLGQDVKLVYVKGVPTC
ncbi:bifunctional diaminohydroxyphosphoribosylaminopyrimidine deaminase/5-amino-6-(5-phosphoribosylamino)uracil reductase RibD [Conservatibacter flavescens]|uniref:Riboflavin biosynthesis protein RibD n=1 Tax=Conservatibacter flavescens TaxID=28161 RepID=A0A2M8S5S0_9PAST|nr:bifunctional diaminohydroxyphosphoribosylaminopyrimidine deaminase/5-amino-6-(5-phosphoribosylamino)uracil reductase RibD [Conservatibacter flavescens]PJG86497.1 riboflavin biosynthesis protein RibD [Conservatibacter flavescens]